MSWDGGIKDAFPYDLVDYNFLIGLILSCPSGVCSFRYAS